MIEDTEGPTSVPNTPPIPTKDPNPEEEEVEGSEQLENDPDEAEKE